MTAPGTIKIDRLALELPGVDAAAGARLATLVASHLARAGHAGSEIAVPRVSLVLDAPEANLDLLAGRIAAAIRRGG
jgi:hypothetical protein